MRADRLIALILLLQARGRMTARDLAKRLEVSVRTIHRDLDALSTAGIPVRAEPGPGGGIVLPDRYRLDLTALNREEARSLFLGTGAAPLADLAVGAVLEGALRKLSAALPAATRGAAERAGQRLLVDPSPWWQKPPPVPAHLRTIEEAVWQDRRLRISYAPSGGGAADRLIDPYALVAKHGVWYLVGASAAGPTDQSRPVDESSATGGCNTAAALGQADLPVPRVFRVSRVRTAELTGEPSRRHQGFDLARFWAEWCAAFVASRPRYMVTLRVSPAAAPAVAQNPIKGGAFLALVSAPNDEGWSVMQADYETLDIALTTVLGFGPAVEVLEPPELRERVLHAASEMVARYGAGGGATGETRNASV
ncbi:MAG: helix-turn-helix transcriptional regulator [Chloroflexota bacterium]